MTIDTIFPGTSRDYTVTIRKQTYVVCNNSGQYARITNYVKEGIPQPNIGIGPQPERTSLGPFIIGDTFTVNADIGPILVEYDNIPQGGDGDVTQSEFDTLQTQVTGQGASISALQTSDASQATDISGLLTSQAAQDTLLTSHTGSISTLTSGLAAQVALEASDVADLQSQIDGIVVSTPGAITGLVDGGVTDNAATFKSFLSVAEDGGTIIAADGVRSEVPASGYYKIASTVNVDGQISMDWSARGAITIVPDGRLPGLTPGTFNSAIRTGGFAPGSVWRMARRSPDIFKQAYEPLYCGINIDATGVKASGTFTCDAAGVFTSSAHGRQNGDIIFIDNLVDGTPLPIQLVNGDDSKYTQSYKISNVTTNTFKVSSWNTGSNDYNVGTVTTAAGTGIWSTNVHGVRIPKNSAGGDVVAGSAAMDPDQDFDDKKEYTAGRFSDGDIVGMSGSGLVSEGGSGRLHIESFRALNNRLHGFDISSNDTVLSGHWGGGGNGGWTLKKGSGTGLYAVTGNIWGKPTARSKNCGAVYCNDTAYFALVCNQPNDWMRFDGDKNFNNSGVIGCNMIHPHGENFSADSVGINVLNDGDVRLQSNIGIQGYQGTVIFGNSWTRTEKNTFNTPGNFGGATNGDSGTAPTWLITFDQNSSAPHQPAMAQIVDGVCTAPDVKPWQGPLSSVTITVASPAVVTWTGHPLVVGDRVRFHSSGTLPTGITGDTVDYYVTTVVDANSFRISATYGGAEVNTSGSAGTGHKCYQLSSSPYYVAGNSQLAGVYVDSYRGVVNLWSKNGIAPKILLGTSPNDSWEGNPTFQVEIGDRRLTSGLPKHQMIYGAVEMDYAPGLRSVTTAANRTTVTSGTKNIDAYAPRWVMNISSPPIASATFGLPGGMTSSYELVLVVNGGVTATTWAYNGSSSLNNKSMIPPTSIQGYTVFRFAFNADNNDWFLLSVNGVRGWTALTDGATIATPAFPDPEGKFFVTLGGNRTLSNPTGGVEGQKYIWRITQDATGSRLITWGNKFKFPGGSPALSTAANAIDLVTGVYDATTNLIYCQLTKAYA